MQSFLLYDFRYKIAIQDMFDTLSVKPVVLKVDFVKYFNILYQKYFKFNKRFLHNKNFGV